ncbi:ATP-binding cassette domain-containing protein [Streptococcus equi subsp. zooepidemicus]|uniref:ABC transporter ATP-binding protein/permease n=1 Tax=Streptococcus equi TaxID=1336 RepID=UPI0013F6138B|nr:ATP-binding cassette domain-containing protein [Streptococcus equi]MCD3433348.1 ATP-binding cassette domain-containing protein [Streptococcus equi subsp. zooepidemicus]MDI5954006.1 ATP-binding cassette domain-containing protein [Streptococcus equi subsp. zooepidemicus]QTZ59300.1 Vitamin B12 import ATP-binding protein BtuD [Streptococcus equi subsp. zooepidemicus]QUF61984.1 ATP-binding cassette domain-containing protein [Streptococcus equi subsp. zooepidemicus]QWN60682.1 ATP-binding cassette
MIKLSNINKKYGKREIFHQLDFTIEQSGLIYTVIGASGSGKTTLLNIIFGLDFDYEGDYYLFERNVRELKQKDWQTIRNRDLQLVFQDYKLTEGLSVLDNLKNAGDFDDAAITDVLIKLDILEFTDQRVAELSGGQKQRVAIARAMLFRPKILLLDEPTSGLDTETTEKLLEYLTAIKDAGVTVLIISHDRLIIDYSDIVLEIEEKTLKKRREAGKTETERPLFRQPTEIKKKKLGRYILSAMRANKFELLLLAVPIMLIFSLFILGFSFYYSTVVGTYNRMFSGVSDTLIMIDTQELKNDVTVKNREKNISSSLDGQRIYFSQADYEHVRQIKGVEAVALTLGRQMALSDKDGYEIDLTYEVEELPDILKKDIGFLSQDTKLTFKFLGLSSPKAFAKDYNTQNITLLTGEFPQNQSLEVILPDIFAQIYFGSDDFDQFIGRSVNLSTFKYGESTNLVERSYQVSGIYRSNYQDTLQPSYAIYLGWDGQGILDEETDFVQMYAEDKVAYIGSSKENAVYLSNIFETLDSYKTAVGLGYTTLLVKVQSPKDVETISQNLEQLFPKYRLTSQLSWKTGEYAKIYQYESKKMLSIACIISLTLGLVITFLNKGYFRKRNRELAVLYSLGYSRGQLAWLILCENLIVFLTCLGLAYGLDRLIYKFYLWRIPYFSGLSVMFTPQVIRLITLLILLITLISVIWNMRGVKLGNLKKSLNSV